MADPVMQVNQLLGRALVGLATVVVLTAGTREAWAQRLVGLSSTNPANLYDISATTGAATLRTQITASAEFTGLAYLNGVLYATDINPLYGLPGTVNDSFGSIDPNTGVFTEISHQADQNWHGLAADRRNSLLYSIDISNDNKLVAIQPNGGYYYIGSGTGIDGRGMAFDNDKGILYATDSIIDPNKGSLCTVDPGTGESQLMFQFTLPGLQYTNLAFVGLAFDDVTDTLFMVRDAFDPSIPSVLYTVDVTTGTVSEVGSLGVSWVDGLEFIPASSPVPEPSSLIIWSLFGGVGAIIGWRRRKQTA